MKNHIASVNEVFTEEALKANDGKKCPLTSSPGGPVIGEVTMHYDPHTKSLMGDLQVDDENVAKFLMDEKPPNYTQREP